MKYGFTSLLFGTTSGNIALRIGLFFLFKWNQNGVVLNKIFHKYLYYKGSTLGNVLSRKYWFENLALLFNFLLSPREISNTVNSFLISSKLKQRRKCKMLWWVRKFRTFSFKKRRPHLLTHISPMFHFYTPWKCQKTFDFLIFSGGAEVEHWAELG